MSKSVRETVTSSAADSCRAADSDVPTCSDRIATLCASSYSFSVAQQCGKIPVMYGEKAESYDDEAAVGCDETEVWCDDTEVWCDETVCNGVW